MPGKDSDSATAPESTGVGRGAGQAHRRVLLVGFMASGKSAVGRELADRLGWRFLDFDEEVERRAGRSIPALFRDEGEEAFRRLEAEVGRDLLTRTEVVLAAGGGWACVPGRMEGLDEETLSVWLRVNPSTAVARAGSRPGGRPLLEAPDPLARARALAREREPYYRKARLHVTTDRRTPSQVAEAIVRLLRP